MSMPQSRAPLIVAIVLLLLPVLYVGSYLALVVPQSTLVLRRKGPSGRNVVYPYRIRSHWLATGFWPLEQIDRKVRPGAWERVGLEKQISGTKVLG